MPDKSTIPDAALAPLGGERSLAFPDRSLADAYLRQRAQQIKEQGGSTIDLSITPSGEPPAPQTGPPLGSVPPGTFTGTAAPVPTPFVTSAPAAPAPAPVPVPDATRQNSVLYQVADKVSRTLTGLGIEEIQQQVSNGTLAEGLAARLLDPAGNAVRTLAEDAARSLGVPSAQIGAEATALLASILTPLPGGKAKAGAEAAAGKLPRAAEEAAAAFKAGAVQAEAGVSKIEGLAAGAAHTGVIPPAAPPLIAQFAGRQEGFGTMAGFDLHNTPVDLTDTSGKLLHPAESTVAASTIQKLRPDVQLGVRVGPREAQAIAEATKGGGATFNVERGMFHEQGQPGYAVSIAPANEPHRQVVLDHVATPQDILKFSQENADVLSAPGAHVGTWLNEGKTHLNVSIVTKDKAKALALGRQYTQQAIYDLEHGVDIPVPADGARTSLSDLHIPLLDRIRNNVGNDFGAVGAKMPYTRHALALAEKGKSGATWYAGVPEELQAQFGADWQMVADLIAVTSPGQRVENNLDLAFQAYRDFKNGVPLEKLLDNLVVQGVTGKIIKNLVGNVLSGQTIEEATTGYALKVRAFARALKGDLKAVVVDRWMHRIFYPDAAGAKTNAAGEAVDATLHPNRYKLIETYITRAAARLGIEPADFQAALWVGKKIEEGDTRGIEPLRDLIRSKLRAGDLADAYAELKPFGLDESGTVNLLAVQMLAQASVGALVGGATGDTLEEHLHGALLGASAGVLPPRIIQKLAQLIREEVGSASFFRKRGPMKAVAATAEEAARFAAVDPNVVQMGDKALAINWSALGDPQGLDDTIKKLAEYVTPEQLNAAKRGVIGDEKLTKLAEAAGISVEDILRAPKGTAANAEQMLATINILGASMKQLSQYGDAWMIARTLMNPEYEARASTLFQNQLGVTAAIFDKFYGMRGEAGRALRVLQGDAQDILPKANDVKSLVNAMRAGIYPPERIAELLAGLHAPEQKASFLGQLARMQVKLLSDAYINGLLATFQGNAANILSNTVATASAVTERFIAAGLGTLRGAAPADKVLAIEAPAMVIGMLHSWRDALGAAAETFKTGVSSFGTSKEIPDSSIQGLSELMKGTGAWGASVEYIAKIALGGGDLATTAQNAERMVGLPGRTLQAADEFSKIMNQRAFIWAEAYREASLQTSGGMLAADQTQEFVHQFVAAPPERVTIAADDFANVQTFTDQLEGRLRAMQTGLSHPLVRFAVPFFRTPVNIFRYNLERVPVLGALVKREREALMAGGAARDLAIAKMSMGAMALSYAGALVYAGTCTGRGPSNPDANLTWRRTHEPYACKIAGKWIGYNRADVYGTLFGTVADLAQISGDLSVDELDEAAVALVVATSNNMLSKTYVQGLHDVLETIAISKPEDFKPNLFKKTVASFIPSGVRQLSKNGLPVGWAGDPTVRETYSFVDELVSRTPWSEMLYPKVDIAGDVVVQPPMLGPDFMSPIPYSDVKKDPVADELGKLQVRIGMPAKAVFGPKPKWLGPARLEDGVQLDAEQNYRFRKLAGNDLKLPADMLKEAFPDLPPITGALGMWDALGAVIQTQMYKASEHGAKKRMVENIVYHYRSAAEKVLIYGLSDEVRAAGVTAPPEFAKGDPNLVQAILEKRLDRSGDIGGVAIRKQLEPTVKRLLESVGR